MNISNIARYFDPISNRLQTVSKRFGSSNWEKLSTVARKGLAKVVKTFVPLGSTKVGQAKLSKISTNNSGDSKAEKEAVKVNDAVNSEDSRLLQSPKHPTIFQKYVFRRELEDLKKKKVIDTRSSNEILIDELLERLGEEAEKNKVEEKGKEKEETSEKKVIEKKGKSKEKEEEKAKGKEESEKELTWEEMEAILDEANKQLDLQKQQKDHERKIEAIRDRLNSDLSRLGEIAKIQPQAAGLSNLWGLYSSPSPDLEQIKSTIESAFKNTIEFLRVLGDQDEKNEQDYEILKKMRAELSNASAALVSLKENYSNSEEEDVEDILKLMDEFMGLLPEVSSNEPSNNWTKLTGTFSESQDSKNLEWKVRKYEAQISELRRHFQSSFPDQFEVNVHGFSFTGHDVQSSGFIDFKESDVDVVARLYKTLPDPDTLFVQLQEKTPNQERYSQEYLAVVRYVINEKFIPEFRKEYNKDPNNPYLQQAAKLLFTEVNIEEQCFETLDTFNKMGAVTLGQQVGKIDENAHGEHLFVKSINTVYQRLKAAPYAAKAPLINQWGNSARGQWNRDFDPYRQGNPTHHFWNLKVGDRVVKMLGMGTPTNEDSNSVARLNEEFKALMKGYKKEGKRHLYVNNQNLIPKTGWLAWFINGDETARSNLILDFQDQEEVKGAYYAIALSKNSPFYWQKGEWTEKSEAESFKDNLYSQVFEENRAVTGNYIPQTLRDLIPDLDDKAKNIMTQIHEKVFEGKNDLSLEERRWFIELFYDNLQKMIIVEGDFDSANISCKDQIDRGAGSNAQLAANSYLIENGELTEEQQKHVMMMMMVRALLVRKRPPLPERVERFCEGMDQSFKHVYQLKALHNALFPNIAMIPQQVTAAA